MPFAWCIENLPLFGFDQRHLVISPFLLVFRVCVESPNSNSDFTVLKDDSKGEKANLYFVVGSCTDSSAGCFLSVRHTPTQGVGVILAQDY